MEAGLKQFIEAYAKDNNLTETEVGMLAGAMSHKAIEKLEEYKKFVFTLNAIAPQLIHYCDLAGRDNKENE